ncbi:MAG TPA: hypothetical protein VMB50_16710 [Myxococcales bacterium]|nr:hypothetical protein [Myxococcales bacterium]
MAISDDPDIPAEGMARAALEPPSSSQALERQLLDRAAQAFQGAGWSVQRQPSLPDMRSGPDLVIGKGSVRYVVEIKASHVPRHSLLQGLLADAILQGRVMAKAFGGRPLAIVGASNISDAMSARFRDYVDEFGVGVAWGCLDERGRFELHGPHLEDVSAPQLELAMIDLRPAPVSPDLFSDLGQWLLKVLLAPRLPKELLGAPRGPLRNARQLADMAQVSAPHASRQVSELREKGFLREEQGLKLVRIRQLLERWRAASSRALRVEVPARWIIPPKNSRRQLGLALRELVRNPREAPELLPRPPRWRRDQPRGCLGLFAALEAHGLLVVHGAPLHLYVDRPSQRMLEDLGLRRAEPGEAVDVFVREPRFPRAVFSGAVAVDGLPVSDIVQCWLDVADHPARGEEQAAQIWERVFEPRLFERDE